MKFLRKWTGPFVRLLCAIQRRAADRFAMTVPWNRRYKPSFSLSQSDEQMGQVIRPLRSSATELFISKHMIDVLARVPRGDPMQDGSVRVQCTVTEPRCSFIDDGRVFSNNVNYVAVVEKGGRVIPEFSWEYSDGKDRRPAGATTSLRRRRFFPRPRIVNGDLVCLLTGGGASGGNYYHWMIDVFPRALLAIRAGVKAENAHFLVPHFATGFEKDSLRLIGVASERVLVGSHFLHCHAGRLVACEWSRRSFITPRWVVDLLREFGGLQPTRRPSTEGGKVYISRGDSRVRSITNERALEDALKREGFSCVQLGSLSLREQIDLFRTARTIVGFHGAGLTNMVFAEPGADVIEFFSSGYVMSYYHDLAAVCGHRYRWKRVEGEASISERNRVGHFVVDPSLVIDLVRQTVADKSG